MRDSYRKFVFADYAFDPQAKRATFEYSLDDTVRFVETVEFDFEPASEYSAEALDRALFGVFIMAGTSYYKAYLPAEIELRAGAIDEKQAAYFTEWYTRGLGEFFFVNGLDPVLPAHFPTVGQVKAPVSVPNLAGTIVPVAGGKDSIVTAELVRQIDPSFETWTLTHSQLLKPLLGKIGRPHLASRRTISPEIITQNKRDAFNGHVPFSAILAFLGVATAILRGKKYLVLSNEASADEGNESYRGTVVNHQYSKSSDFERGFQEYTRSFISPDLTYFSLLRPLRELRIAELFANRWFDTYAGLFSSCNRNFTIGGKDKLAWCGHCPKCVFTFLMLAPFVPKDELVALLGTNPLADPRNDATVRELLGLSGHKPFECVGEIEEVRQAVRLTRIAGTYPELDAYEVPPGTYDFRALGAHMIPKPFQKVIDALAEKPVP